jgi:hypothetical protein
VRLIDVYVAFAPEPETEESDDDLIELDLFADISMEGVTSGSDSTAWDPIRIEKDGEDNEDDEVLDTDMKSDDQTEGVTSGNESPPTGDVKSSQRKNRQPQ